MPVQRSLLRRKAAAAALAAKEEDDASSEGGGGTSDLTESSSSSSANDSGSEECATAARNQFVDDEAAEDDANDDDKSAASVSSKEVALAAPLNEPSVPAADDDDELPVALNGDDSDSVVAEVEGDADADAPVDDEPESENSSSLSDRDHLEPGPSVYELLSAGAKRALGSDDSDEHEESEAKRRLLDQLVSEVEIDDDDVLDEELSAHDLAAAQLARSLFASLPSFAVAADMPLYQENARTPYFQLEDEGAATHVSYTARALKLVDLRDEDRVTELINALAERTEPLRERTKPAYEGAPASIVHALCLLLTELIDEDIDDENELLIFARDANCAVDGWLRASPDGDIGVLMRPDKTRMRSQALARRRDHELTVQPAEAAPVHPASVQPSF